MADTTTPLYGYTQPEVGASTDTWGGKLNTDLLAIEQEIARHRLPFLTPAVGPTTTLDFNQTSGARIFAFTVSQATTLAFTNVPSASFFARALLKITNGAAFALTFPASVVWSGGSPPTFSAAGVDWVEMFTIDAGVTWYARAVYQTTVATSITNVRRLWTSGQLSRSGADISVGSFNVPASLLVKNGDELRIKLRGVVAAVSTCAFSVKFGSVTVHAATPPNGAKFDLEIKVSRVALNQQVAGVVYNETGSISGTTQGRFTPNQTETNAILVDVHASTTGGGTITIDNVTIEYVPSSN